MKIFATTAARIDVTGKFQGMISVEVFNTEEYCEFVVDGGFIVYQSIECDPTLDVVAFAAAKKFEETE